MKEKIQQVETLIREIMDEATNKFEGDELNQFIGATENMLNNLEIAESIGVKETIDDDANTDLVMDLEDQMNNHPLFRRYSDSSKAVLIQKMMNEGKPLVTQEELVDFANEKLRDMPLEQLITQAYGRDEIIRVGRNSNEEENLGDGFSYQKGLEILIEEAVEPDNLNSTKALAIQNMLKNPKELDKLVFEYYGI